MDQLIGPTDKPIIYGIIHSFVYDPDPESSPIKSASTFWAIFRPLSNAIVVFIPLVNPNTDIITKVPCS